VVAVEGALSGVPTVGTDVGFLAEWAPSAAVTVPVGDAGALAAAVAEILMDEERRLGLAREARMRAEGQDADVAAARMAGLYRRVTSRSPDGRRPPSEATDHR